MQNKLLSVISSCFLAAAAFGQDHVTLFEDCNYFGRSYILAAGNYKTYQMKIRNDRLSSIQVPAGMKITIYEHSDFKGRQQTITSSIPCFSADWNDQVSSIVVESTYQYNPNDFVTFYNDCYSRGYSRSLGPGTYTGNDLGLLMNNISSFSIYGNLRVKAYMTNSNASGYNVNFDDNQTCLPGSYNDKIKSLVIEYRRTGGDYNNNNYGGTNYATIYTDCSYRGNSIRLSPGNYQGDKLGLLRFDISSIELPSNLRAKVYVNNEYLSGSYYTLNESSNCLSANLNNRIGSLVIEERGNNNNNNNYFPPGNDQRVTIYSEEKYQGQSVSLLPGTYYSMSQVGFPDNAMSSLVVPEGYRVVIYEFENFKGKSYTIMQSKTKFYLSGWNDKTSSIAVYRDR